MPLRKTNQREDPVRLARQVRRLRDLLAEAWVQRWPESAIHRIELDLARRWYRLDRTKRRPQRPTPA